MHWYIHALKNYATFHGRAPRIEFWTFFLVNSVIVMGIEAAFGMRSGPERVFEVLVFLPLLAVTVRRLHDSSHSGWWALLLFIPLVGWIGLLVFMLLRGKPYMNVYGPELQHPEEMAHA